MSAYPSGARTDWTLLARRVVVGTAVTCAVLLLLAMVLSYAGLRSFYLGAGLPERWASAYPFCVDLLALVAYVAWLSLGGWYPAAVVIFGVAASALAQGYHISHGGVDAQVTGWFVLGLAGASAMVCAGLAAHLFVKIIKRALPVDFISAMRGTAQVTPAAPIARDAVPTPDLPPSNRVHGVPTPLDPMPADPFPDVERLLVDYDNDLTRQLASSNGFHNPPRTTEPRAPENMIVPPARLATSERAPSQARGPCSARCGHHRGETVAKSTRYRCQAGLDGKPNGCPECTRSREAGNG